MLVSYISDNLFVETQGLSDELYPDQPIYTISNTISRKLLILTLYHTWKSDSEHSGHLKDLLSLKKIVY